MHYTPYTPDAYSNSASSKTCASCSIHTPCRCAGMDPVQNRSRARTGLHRELAESLCKLRKRPTLTRKTTQQCVGGGRRRTICVREKGLTAVDRRRPRRKGLRFPRPMNRDRSLHRLGIKAMTIRTAADRPRPQRRRPPSRHSARGLTATPSRTARARCRGDRTSLAMTHLAQAME